MSRLREFPEKLFEVFLEIGKPTDAVEAPFILQKYPPDYEEEEVLKSAPKFAFPCDTERTTVDVFTFVLTDLDSKFKFGFCRHATGAQTGFCIISFLPWFEVFYNFLHILAEITNRPEDSDIISMLRSAYAHDVPGPGVPVTIVANQEMFSFKAPEANKLPSIPASRNLTEYYTAIDVQNMMVIFASMLHERRIVVISKKLSRLTAVVHAAGSLLYPMFWQHLFIPVLPSFLVDYLTAPMPFVIGVHSNLIDKVRESELGDAVIVDADKNEVTSDYDDLENLPDEVVKAWLRRHSFERCFPLPLTSDLCLRVVCGFKGILCKYWGVKARKTRSSYLKRHLKGDKVKNSMQGSGDVISKTFMMSLVKLIGGYRDALKFNLGATITFNPEAFVQSRPASMQPFLQDMLCLQIFQQFINDRLDMLNCGRGFEDLFEQECLLHADKMNAQTRYNEWLQRMKKQGKKLQRGGKDVWSDFKDKAGPAMSSAVESVKIQGKKAYSKARTRISDMKKVSDKTSHLHPTTIIDDSPEGSPKSSKSDRNGLKAKSFSKGKASGIPKDRPSTIVGAPLSTQRPPRPPATQKSNDTPNRPIPVIKQPMSERSNRYTHLNESGHRTSSDDTDVLRYSRVSCNLLSDPDLQQAMYKSASAENIPKVHPALKTSDSTGTLTSESSGDLAEEPGNIPYMDRQDGGTHQNNRDSAYISYTNLLDDDDSGIVMRTGSQSSLDKSKSESKMKPELPPRGAKLAGSSSDSKLPPPRPSPRSSLSPGTPQMADRLIRQNANAVRERPKPAPRRQSLETSTEQSQPDEFLISLETPSEEKEHFSLVGQFDSMEVGGEYVTLRHAEPATSNRNENRRSSISRTPAMKMQANETPKRPSIRRERSPVSPDEESHQTGSAVNFDPLFDQSGSPQLNKNIDNKSPVQTDSNNSNSNSLLMDWNIKDLTSMSNTPTQSSYPYSCHPTPSPRGSMGMNNLNNYYTPPQQYPKPAPVSLNYQNPLGPYNTSTPPPCVPARPKSRPSDGASTGSPGNLLQPKSNDRQGTVNKSDPFADLVTLRQPVQQSPQPQKPSWQTFD